MEIKHVEHDQIDMRKWDQCIRSAVNGHVFGLSWYLNAASDHWNALIEDDYVSVMPLPFQSRMGFKTLLIPAKTNPLGVFSTGLLNRERVEAFVDAIPSTYWFGKIGLNLHNRLGIDFHRKTSLKEKMLLDQIKSYQSLQGQYAQSVTGLLSKAKEDSYSMVEGVNSHEFLQLYELHGSGTKDDIDFLRKLISVAIRYRIGKLLGVYGPHNSLIAAAFLITAMSRTVLVALASQQQVEPASVYLVDQFFKMNAGQVNVFDFHEENSLGDGFGASKITYAEVKMNRFGNWLTKR